MQALTNVGQKGLEGSPIACNAQNHSHESKEGGLVIDGRNAREDLKQQHDQLLQGE